MRYFTSMFPDHCAAIMKLLHLPRVVLDNASRMNLNFLHVAKARHETGVPGLTAVKAALISEKMGKMRSISFSQIIFCLKSILFKLKRATMLERFFLPILTMQVENLESAIKLQLLHWIKSPLMPLPDYLDVEKSESGHTKHLLTWIWLELAPQEQQVWRKWPWKPHNRSSPENPLDLKDLWVERSV